MRQSIKIGTKVSYRPGFGYEKPVEVVVEGIDRCKHKGDKEGYPVDHIAWSLKDYCVFDMSNGHWCYGDQIDYIV